jgi:hypothetical protein
MTAAVASQNVYPSSWNSLYISWTAELRIKLFSISFLSRIHGLMLFKNRFMHNMLRNDYPSIHRSIYQSELFSSLGFTLCEPV